MAIQWDRNADLQEGVDGRPTTRDNRGRGMEQERRGSEPFIERTGNWRPPPRQRRRKEWDLAYTSCPLSVIDAFSIRCSCLVVALVVTFSVPASAVAQPLAPLYDCDPDRGGSINIDRISKTLAEVVLLGRGLDRDAYVFVDGAIVQTTSADGHELRFPIEGYPGDRELPATVEIQARSADGEESNKCRFSYPYDFPLLIGGATGLTNRDGEPAAMVLAFIGLRHGSVQNPVPRFHKDGRPMGFASRVLRRLYLLGGYAKIAGTEGSGWMAGVGLRTKGDIKVMYAIRANSMDYPRHIFGVAGTIKVADLARSVSE